jgi:enoyl-[acyl-carrier protein] reductase II
MFKLPKREQDMTMRNSFLTKELGLKYPIIQAGMVWISGAKLCAASANAGILGVLGAGSMKPELLSHHIQKTKALTQNLFAINLPLLYKDCEEQLEIALSEKIRIFITSAGSPKKFTNYLKSNGCYVIHVTSNPDLALKCQDAGVDAVICEGFEAGGHNGIDELTTLTLIPQVLKKVKIPVIAAGGIATGEALLAMECLGAQGSQLGTRFIATQESSAHINFKKMILNSNHTSTALMMKKLLPVRLLKNPFYSKVHELENRCASVEELRNLLSKGRAKKGMLEGDLIEGELEVGQICGLIEDIPTVDELVQRLVHEYNEAKNKLLN